MSRSGENLLPSKNIFELLMGDKTSVHEIYRGCNGMALLQDISKCFFS